MSCSGSSEISFEFLDNSGTVYLEIRPRSMQFKEKMGEFDYCKCEFSQEVAEHIQPYVEDEDSFLRRPLPVILKIEGEPISRMLWVSDGARFTDNAVHIEFHDPQKFLTRGVVDMRRDNIMLKDAYRYVFEQRDTSGPEIFKGIYFTVPDSVNQEVSDSGSFSDQLAGNYIDDSISSLGDDLTEDSISIPEPQIIKDIEQTVMNDILWGHYELDFDKISPWEAIVHLNDKFGITTWTSPNGYLMVGSRSTTGVRHIAAPDDRRVWKLSDYNISPPRDPITKYTVVGGWRIDPTDTAGEYLSDFADLNTGTKDFRIHGVATRKDVTFGQEEVEEINAKKDSLEAIAKRKLSNKEKEQWSGYIEINPEISGRSTEPRYVQIGDVIQTAPPEAGSKEDTSCSTNIREELYHIVGIQHELSKSGNWNLRLDIVPVLDDELDPNRIDTNIRYYDPSEREYIEGDPFSPDRLSEEFFLNKFLE